MQKAQVEPIYLNNTGSKYKIPGSTVRVIGERDGIVYYDKVRTVEYFEQFGNGVLTTVKWKNIRHTGFQRDGNVLYLEKCRTEGTANGVYLLTEEKANGG